MRAVSAAAKTDAVIVGAGPAGLAVGACLRHTGVPFVILEQGDTVGSTWHRHYERLHLHTDRDRSELPFVHYPRGYPRYPSRLQVIAYLEEYARRFGLAPRFGQGVISARRQDGLWQVRTPAATYLSSSLILATGYNGQPHIPTWPGQDLFEGEVLHSSRYTSGARFRGKRVLVVGLGNSGGEIAIDLWEHGGRPALAVRGPVNIIPRDLLGIPILAIAIPLTRLPGALADTLTSPVLRLLFGDRERLGLEKPPDGPFAQIRRRGRIPLIDVGTVGLIRQGHVDVRPRVERFSRTGVVFVGGAEERFDAVILATGFRPAFHTFLEEASAVTDGIGNPRCSGRETELRGLYFCGFHVSPTGMLREIALEARAIAHDIAGKAIPRLPILRRVRR
ncbi:MAG: flavin-containing monooxygenase [bacterium]